MRKQLLVTSAILALAAGTGFANAQGTPGAAEPKQPAVSEQPAPSTQPKGTEGQAQPKSSEGQAQQKGSEGTVQQKGTAQEKGTTQKNQAQDKGATKDKAAQKSGDGASASLSTEQRTRVREVIIKQGNAPRVTSVNFSLNVGTVVPRTVRVVALPAPVIEIYPAWRGYLYFLVGDQIVVVEPGSLRIVAVIAA